MVLLVPTTPRLFVVGKQRAPGVGAEPEELLVGVVPLPFGDRSDGDQEALSGDTLPEPGCQLGHIPQAIEKSPIPLGPLEFGPHRTIR